MTLTELSAISPVDGRYRNKTEILGDYFSEYALIKYRVMVEIEYFIALVQIPLPGLKNFPQEKIEILRQIYTNFSPSDSLAVKQIERTTNHDVKAVEYFLKEKFDEIQLSGFKELIHFALTSQDINNTATPLSLKKATEEIYLPALEELLAQIKAFAREGERTPMLARTHGQPASPTRLGKEMFVFAERLEIQTRQLEKLSYPAKFGGATGNFNAHVVAFPEIDWKTFADRLVNDILGLSRSKTTTQIEHYDNLAALFDNFKRINTILIDFSRDIWAYIAFDYFKQKIKKGEVGSSAMPHKVNPIDFENAEGNLGIANALFEHLAAKLPVSRLQRDLTDSTVLRNIGVPLAHTKIAFDSLRKGIGKLLINHEAINRDLENNWSVVAEAIQTILRREGYPNPYETLKELTRTNKKTDAAQIAQFIENLDLPQGVKNELRQITPQNYTGV